MTAFKYTPDFTDMQTGYKPVKIAGWHDLKITGADMVATKDKTGAFLQIDIEVASGEEAGSTVTMRINIDNKNPEAVKIAKRQLNTLCAVVGLVKVVDTKEFVGKLLRGNITVEEVPNNNNPEIMNINNEVKGLRTINDERPSAPTKAGAAQAPVAAKPIPKPAPQAPAATQEVEQDDDIPFDNGDTSSNADDDDFFNSLNAS